MRFIFKILRSVQHAFQGLTHAYRHEFSFRVEVWAGLIFIIVAYMFWPISFPELISMALAYSLILSFELVNTALERMFARLHPEHHELVGISKDLASAAVLVAVLFAGCVLAGIVFLHL